MTRQRVAGRSRPRDRGIGEGHIGTQQPQRPAHRGPQRPAAGRPTDGDRHGEQRQRAPVPRIEVIAAVVASPHDHECEREIGARSRRVLGDPPAPGTGARGSARGDGLRSLRLGARRRAFILGDHARPPGSGGGGAGTGCRARGSAAALSFSRAARVANVASAGPMASSTHRRTSSPSEMKKSATDMPTTPISTARARSASRRRPIDSKRWIADQVERRQNTSTSR